LERARNLAHQKVKDVAIPQSSAAGGSDPWRAPTDLGILHNARQALQSYSFEPAAQEAATDLMKHRFTKAGYDPATIAKVFAQ
jgi:hypothetical protein